jgi:hypothetical protein
MFTETSIVTTATGYKVPEVIYNKSLHSSSVILTFCALLDVLMRYKQTQKEAESRGKSTARSQTAFINTQKE